ncbi:MAG: efflux RND transporter periplasmic adaptor subunit [Elusimicrobiota bacterium]
MKKRYWLILAILILAIFGGIFYGNKKKIFNSKPKESNITLAEAQRGNITIKLQVKGIVKPLKSIPIYPPNRGGKITFLITEGAYVKNDDLIAQFDKVDLETRLSDDNYRLEQEFINEDKRLKDADKQVTQSYLKLQEAREKLRAVIPEVMNGNKSSADLKWAKQSVKEATIDYDLAKRYYTQYKTTGSPQMRDAKRNNEQLKKDLTQTDVYAPAEGLVVYEEVRVSGTRTEKVKPGDTVWRGQAIMSIPDLSKMSVIAEVNEVDLSKIQINDDCVIRIDAYPDQRFYGKVTRCENLVKDSVFTTGTKIVEVQIIIDGTNTILKPGMTAGIDIITNRLSQVVYVPINAVFEDESGQYYCQVSSGTQFIKRTVVTGDSNNDNIVILDGIKEGEKVALSNPATTEN